MAPTNYDLDPPSLEELTRVVRPALEQHYAQSSISVGRCPDLRKAPFTLAQEGLCGNPAIADVGGQTNLFPTPNLSAKFSLLEIAGTMGMHESRGSLLGPGAGPFWDIGQNSELAASIAWEDGFENVTNCSRIAKIDNSTAEVIVEPSPSTGCGLMGNFFLSLGLPGPILHISARSRTGSQASFTEVLREALAHHYGDRQVSLGGVFLMKKGKGKYHIMPDFPSSPFADGQAVQDWLTWHEFACPMVCLSVLHSVDAKGVGLRMEHTHCFGIGEEGGMRGGHYHGDVLGDGEGDEVEFEACFNVAESVWRIERPEREVERG